MAKVKATCAWGEGPDVIVTLEDHNFMLYEEPDGFKHSLFGDVKNGSFELTAEQALELAYNLTCAAKAAKELDESYARFVEHEQKCLKVLEMVRGQEKPGK
jgi:hypothetical protein